MRFVLSLCSLLLWASRLFALGPADVVLLVNRNMAESADVAEHYRTKRGVPKENVILLDLPKTDDISRHDYERKMVAPIRAALKDRKDKIKVLLCIYGVPLRVGGPEPDEKEKAELAKVQGELGPLRERLKQAQEQIKQLGPAAKKEPASAIGKEAAQLEAERSKLQQQEQRLERRRLSLSHAESHAAVDNELMLLWWDMMTARLDAPTPAIAKRLVDDALEVEAKGLRGKVYVDARDNRYDPKSDSGYGYGGYDESMREMAHLLKDDAKMDVTLDNKPAVFAAGSCPECALYCGWYSHGNFVDSNQFVKGAVAWHLASSEAVSLRRKDSKLWCPNILAKGAAATLGPVAEPYTLGFPKPAEFFGFLVTGEFTLVECYSRTLNVTSWMVTLIGDPLYNPFQANSRLKSSQVLPSPKGGKFLK